MAQKDQKNAPALSLGAQMKQKHISREMEELKALRETIDSDGKVVKKSQGDIDQLLKNTLENIWPDMGKFKGHGKNLMQIYEEDRGWVKWYVEDRYYRVAPALARFVDAELTLRCQFK